MYVIRAQNDVKNGHLAIQMLIQGNKRLLTATASPNDRMLDNADGLKLPAV